MNEFERWCALKGIQPVPAPIAAVTQFVETIAPLGDKRVWEIVQEISHAHYLNGFADPTLSLSLPYKGDLVLHDEPPRSWPAERKERFRELPEDWRRFLATHDKRRERTFKLAMQHAHDVRVKHGLPKLPKDFYREKSSKAA